MKLKLQSSPQGMLTLMGYLEELLPWGMPFQLPNIHVPDLVIMKVGISYEHSPGERVYYKTKVIPRYPMAYSPNLPPDTKARMDLLQRLPVTAVTYFGPCSEKQDDARSYLVVLTFEDELRGSFDYPFYFPVEARTAKPSVEALPKKKNAPEGAQAVPAETIQKHVPKKVKEKVYVKRDKLVMFYNWLLDNCSRFEGPFFGSQSASHSEYIESVSTELFTLYIQSTMNLSLWSEIEKVLPEENNKCLFVLPGFKKTFPAAALLRGLVSDTLSYEVLGFVKPKALPELRQNVARYTVMEADFSEQDQIILSRRSEFGLVVTLMYEILTYRRFTPLRALLYLQKLFRVTDILALCSVSTMPITVAILKAIGYDTKGILKGPDSQTNTKQRAYILLKQKPVERVAYLLKHSQKRQHPNLLDLSMSADPLADLQAVQEHASQQFTQIEAIDVSWCDLFSEQTPFPVNYHDELMSLINRMCSLKKIIIAAVEEPLFVQWSENLLHQSSCDVFIRSEFEILEPSEIPHLPLSYYDPNRRYGFFQQLPEATSDLVPLRIQGAPPDQSSSDSSSPIGSLTSL